MRRESLLVPFIVLLALLAAGLACQAEHMRARELPVWTCPTETPQATHTLAPGWEALTPPPATYTPFPTPTPFSLTTDFPLGKHVQIGGLGGVGLGLWVWMEEVEVLGPFRTRQGETEVEQWVAAWSVTVENASLSRPYEFYPFAQLYVLELTQPDGSPLRGAWGLSAQAQELAGLAPLELTEAASLIPPGEQRTFRVAAFVPLPEVWRLAYVLDPLDTADLEAMAANHSLGSNVGVWVNATDERCQGEITAQAPTAGEGFLLARHPVEGSPQIARGFGCSDFYTGELGTACPAGAPWFHNGVDYLVPSGAPYIDPLPVPGQVSYAGEHPSGPDCAAMPGSQPPHRGYGNYVRHEAMVNGHQVSLWGAHLSAFSTASGAATAPGAILGRAGSTGCSSGPHLHFSVRVDGLYVDPLTLIP